MDAQNLIYFVIAFSRHDHQNRERAHFRTAISGHYGPAPTIPADPAAQRTLDAPAARFILPAGALSCAWFQPKLVVLGQIDRLLAELGQVHQAGLFGQIEIRWG